MKLRAEIVSAVAPQIPFLVSFLPSSFFFGAGTRQGPIPQFLQQLPSAPMGHGFMVSARSKTVETPSEAAFSIICCVASQIVFFPFVPSFFFFSPVFFTSVSFAMTSSLPLVEYCQNITTENTEKVVTLNEHNSFFPLPLCPPQLNLCFLTSATSTLLLFDNPAMLYPSLHTPCILFGQHTIKNIPLDL